MKIYDLSQEVFSCVVFPGDPAPKREILATLSAGDACNLTAFSMCAHNGTHVDAPYHFLNDGVTVEQLPLAQTVGYAYLAEHEGIVTAEDAKAILGRAQRALPESAKRILLKGRATVSADAARVFAEAGLLLLGNESQTVGPEQAPREVHLILLSAGVTLLEGIRPREAGEGVYLLSAAPLALGGADGAPCRATLVRF